METERVPLHITEIGGACPTQASGTMYGCPFYYRSRHDEWDLTVTRPGVDPVLPAEQDRLVYLHGEDSHAGCVPLTDVLLILENGLQELRLTYPDLTR